jgi:type III restriction enzyme
VPPVQGRRRSELITPVPKPRKRKNRGKGEQGSLVFSDGEGLSSAEQEYNPTPIINEIRSYIAAWRDLPNAADWGVTPTTARLLTHWRHHNFGDARPFFCRIEAVETLIWLTEVARPGTRYAKFWEHLKGANEQANPELLRIASKMATGSGKTTVMAMLIAWQAINAVRSPASRLFSRGFLLVAPGISHQGSAARATAGRPRQLLSHARARAGRHAGRDRQGEDRHYQLPRLQAP